MLTFDDLIDLDPHTTVTILYEDGTVKEKTAEVAAWEMDNPLAADCPIVEVCLPRTFVAGGMTFTVGGLVEFESRGEWKIGRVKEKTRKEIRIDVGGHTITRSIAKCRPLNLEAGN
jgi:hypothetical protein